MKKALFLLTILFGLSCRKPQALFQKSQLETSTEQPKKFSFKINPIKLKSKPIRIDSSLIYKKQNPLQRIDNQLFVNKIETQKETFFVERKSLTKEKITVQHKQNSNLLIVPFGLILGATMLFAVVVSISFLIVSGSISTAFRILSSLLALVGLNHSEILSKKQINRNYNSLIISFLALLMLLITSLVLANW